MHDDRLAEFAMNEKAGDKDGAATRATAKAEGAKGLVAHAGKSAMRHSPVEKRRPGRWLSREARTIPDDEAGCAEGAAGHGFAAMGWAARHPASEDEADIMNSALCNMRQ